jgi:hypothetical protein
MVIGSSRASKSDFFSSTEEIWKTRLEKSSSLCENNSGQGLAFPGFGGLSCCQLLSDEGEVSRSLSFSW